MNLEKQLEYLQIVNFKKVYRNLPTPVLVEKILENKEGILAHMGPIVVESGKYTGRSPKDKFIVKQDPSKDHIWWGKENQEISPQAFDNLYKKVVAYLQQKEIYIMDGYAGADPRYRLPIRVISTLAWQSLFARNMFIRELDPKKLENFEPGFTVIAAPEFKAIPEIDGTRSEVFVLLNFEKKIVLIGGSGYSGEIKKSVFSVMNYLMPLKGIMSMHASANLGKGGDVAIFFGLSGTGKTTLSSDPERFLIGDDEHGWSDDGVFNFEGGCYAKVINLSKDDEPLIYETTRKFGTILENVVIDKQTRRVDLFNDSITENTRASYPITYIPNALKEGIGPHPKNIIMLTYDAFGVLPPVSKLTTNQAMYHFISGYTAKVAGTEAGVEEPTAVFSTCFGAPFMVLPPTVYAKLLGEKIQKHSVNCWLVNTGLNGGPYGIGKRISISHTRAIIRAILSNELNDVEYEVLPIFNLHIPKNCPEVPQNILNPRQSWKDKDAYDNQLKKLALAFKKNLDSFGFEIDKDIIQAGPQI
ncbi:MAG: phosphoenolpyruvate carboxykinase (ATP) [Desulfurella sp.]|uniref:phosphoenolpyruvate carboxykinase (ATP) n=1 Tax=Desulfurella TaxID=33001 RepID=UPI000CA7FAA7|nr:MULTISPECIES: phosphoenolpyruvate carboxykinase (ATP) [Desulfurella]PMP67254.1 MAG: phosphoenolpyruvate carboxykinase (ATP) [Desulfurella multipotens]PMP89466.1 MAG: phosphoenolpyruvate carboxykinase (ATP) [Desulfurella sp.]